MFEHRSYLGWITDLASRPHPTTPWPAINLEEWLLEDYAQTFATMQRIGLNEIVIWGLFVAGAWPTAVETAVDEGRAQRLRQLLDVAHAHGIKVLSGLGVFSWGFQEIIADYPQLSRGNPRAMCASNPDAWLWQERVVDFALGWDLDGVSMQSADQGRCPCYECAQLGDVEYHARLNSRTADYVKNIRPDAIVGVNSWGMTFADPANLPHLVELGRHVDYIVDAHDTARKAGEEYRRRLIAAVPCAWGTIGGWAVEPPQHWARDRWFLPCIANVVPHVDRLRADGGRACELFFRIAANPGDELSLLVCGRLLGDDYSDWRRVLTEAVHATYRPATERAATGLADVFLRAEAAYFDNATGLNRIGTISLEPLKSDQAGEPIYLMDHMTPPALDRYVSEMRQAQDAARGLVGMVGDRDRVEMIVRCIDGVLHDAAYTRTKLEA
jgi:hypothetical protein